MTGGELESRLIALGYNADVSKACGQLFGTLEEVGWPWIRGLAADLPREGKGLDPRSNGSPTLLWRAREETTSASC